MDRPYLFMKWKKAFWDFIYSFPIQLLMLHLKKQHLLLAMWVLLSLMFTGALASKFGIIYLFMDPEYLGKVGFLSFFFIGAGFATLFVSWNITTYILNSYHFSFLATLSKPFSKFCLNNFLFPLCFGLLYLFSFIHFQLEVENVSYLDFSQRLAGLLMGFISICVFSFAYFFRTNTNLSKFLGVEQLIPNLKYKKVKISNIGHDNDDDDKWKVVTFLSNLTTIRLVRETSHYDIKTLSAVFKQNHVNALVIEVCAFIVLISLSFLDEVRVFKIPAGASMLLIFSIVIMFLGAFGYWLRGWTYSMMIILLIGLNFILELPFFEFRHLAYGMRYQKPLAVYNDHQLGKHSSDNNIKKDYEEGIKILENWKALSASQRNPKPKLILINSSGGGLRSSLWNVCVMQAVDSVINGDLMKHSTLITGASGGMLGASYYRELYLRKQMGEKVNINSPSHLKNMGLDLLNDLSFTLLVNDLYNPFHSIKKWGQSYPMDRGYSFEKHLHKNTKWVLDKNLHEYKDVEYNGIIPTMILSPIITNDAKTLLISSQNVSYLSRPIKHNSDRFNKEVEGVEFRKLFNNHSADSLRFSTALRMSATFPYIMPNIALPSSPRIEVMDAGMRDNFGTWISMKYLYTFKDWIKDNTSGVILLQIRDTPKLLPKDKEQKMSLIRRVFYPIGNFFTNWHEIQDLQIDNIMGTSLAWFDHDLDFIHFEYNPSDRDKRASLSWHLTKREKENVLNNINSRFNQNSLAQIKRLMENNTAEVD